MIIKNGNVVLPDKILSRMDILCQNGIIERIEEKSKASSDQKIIDADGCYVLPGLVDIHTHGGFGSDFMDATDKAFENALKFHSQNGTTALLTSSVTAHPEQILKMLKFTRKYMNRENTPCRVLGAHIEGPYISYKNKGAQKAEYLRIPSKDDYAFILDNSDVIKNVTIASELEGSVKMVKDLIDKEITVSCGHDDGNKETLLPVINAGVTNCTHWYCAMSTAHVRDGVRNVGLMELGLIDNRLTLELLADNHHLPPELVILAYKMKGADKLCIVSDCLRAGGMPKNCQIYTLGTAEDDDTTKFIVSDGVAKLINGTHFAGSIQSIGQMLRNIVNDCGICLTDAVKMASLTPAKIIKVDKLIGSIEIGKKADFYITDNKLQPVCTIINGNKVNF